MKTPRTKEARKGQFGWERLVMQWLSLGSTDYVMFLLRETLRKLGRIIHFVLFCAMFMFY